LQPFVLENGGQQKTGQKILPKKKIGKHRVRMVCRGTPTPFDRAEVGFRRGAFITGETSLDTLSAEMVAAAPPLTD
jgi:hypothetical protein